MCRRYYIDEEMAYSSDRINKSNDGSEVFGKYYEEGENVLQAYKTFSPSLVGCPSRNLFAASEIFSSALLTISLFFFKGAFEGFHITNTVWHFGVQTAYDVCTILLEQPRRTACAISAEQSHCADNVYFLFVKSRAVLRDKIIHNFRQIAIVNRICKYDMLMLLYI